MTSPKFITFTPVRTSHEERAQRYINATLAVSALRSEADRQDNGQAYRALDMAVKSLEGALAASIDNPRQAQRLTANAFEYVRAACPTLPCPPPSDRANVARFHA